MHLFTDTSNVHNIVIIIHREFIKRMDSSLPFYYCTLNERFRDEELESFYERPNIDENVHERRHPLRLHRLKLNRREDPSIFAPGRAFLPSRNKPTIRQRLHRHEVPLPPIPENQEFSCSWLLELCMG